MARSSLQKLKLIYLKDYLEHYSDEDHPVSVADMIAHLEKNEINAERKSIYDDLEVLQTYGMDIIKLRQGKSTLYYLGKREFELPELKLMVDSVQSSKFITQKKTLSLIKKIENLASVHQAQSLNRQVFVKSRIKSMNESIYYNVDDIHNGIAQNKQIQFHYFEYTVEKKQRLRHDGAFYQVSPFALTWDDENYYMVAYDSKAQCIKHFRVDKMRDISLTDVERDGMRIYAALDMGLYAKKVFGMFSGEEESVQLRFDNSLVGAVLDRLGQDVILVPDGEKHFTVRTNIVVSPQFFAWVVGFGTMAQILAPQSVVNRMREHLDGICTLYEDMP